MTGPYRDMPSHGIAYDTWSGACKPAYDDEGFCYIPEHVSIGINAGPITGMSIDLFNDPTDTVGDGWAKRMALSAGEGAAGVGLLGAAGADMMEGDFLTAAGEGVAGAGMLGLSAFSGAYNTYTAIDNGMTLGDAATGMSNLGGDLYDAGGEALGDLWAAIP